MKKTLILIVLNCFLWQNELFAVIQKAQLPLFFTPIDTVKEECAKIKLKNGRTIHGTIKNINESIFKINYQPCASSKKGIRSLFAEEVVSITDENGKVLFIQNKNWLWAITKKYIIVSVLTSVATILLNSVNPYNQTKETNIFLGIGLFFLPVIGLVAGVKSLIGLWKLRSKNYFALIAASIATLICAGFTAIFVWALINNLI